ncbi:SDR family oxidoreductase [Flavihumibacter profundi]|uniref:SDR family oxidoreductase n=1 Tax=Flavihumibacter profundi TaxID=2716883 RepID=UPI0021D42BCA|nr:SDR family oxidoreductase [Flavihumibacter profundi]
MANCPSHWQVHGLSRTKEIPRGNNIVYHKLDMLDREKLPGLLQSIKPDVVIHTAAMANIDYCEINKDIAEQVNTGITAHLCAICKNEGARLIFCSTDTVFDGSKGYYTETDIPHPVNFYASTKIKSEQEVLSAGSRNVVARLSLVMGLPVLGRGNSFLADTISKLKNGEQVKFPENEIRTPIDVITLGNALIELAGNDFGGLIHLAGNTRINRFEMAKQIADALGLSEELIVKTDSSKMAGRAPRPNDVSLDNSKARKVLSTPMLSLADGLALTMNF